MFFIAAALVLTTAGVFAGKVNSKFNNYNLYAWDGTAGGYNVLETSTFTSLTGTSLSFSPGTQVTIKGSNSASASYGLYAYDGTYHALTSSF